MKRRKASKEPPNALAAKCRRLEQEREENKKKISSLRGKLATKKLRVERLKKSLESTKTRNEELEERVERLEERVSSVLDVTQRTGTQQTAVAPEKLGSLDFGSSSEGEGEGEKYEAYDENFDPENSADEGEIEEEEGELEEDIAPIEKVSTEDPSILSEDDEVGYDDNDDYANEEEEEENEEDIEKEFIKLRKSYSQNLSAEIESDEERQRKAESLGYGASSDKMRIRELEEELTRSKSALIDANAKMVEAQRLYNKSNEMWSMFNEDAVMLEESGLFDSLAELTKELGAFKKARKAEAECCESLKMKIFEVCAKLNKIKAAHRQIKRSSDGARTLSPHGKRRSVSFDISYTPLRQKRSKGSDIK